jgi:histidine triad (HIT) family protein
MFFVEVGTHFSEHYERHTFRKDHPQEIPATFVYEDDDVIAIRDKFPAAETHILIIPRKPIPTIDDLTENDQLLLGKMILTAKKLAKEEGLIEGYRLVMNCNAHGGQTIFHLHLHLIGGRALSWPPG